MREVGTDSYYYFYNGHADVTALMDITTGTIDASYYYDAFGNILESTGSVSNNIKYAGYQYDEETGYYYLNARMYDPITARFLQEDTYSGDPNDPLSLNLYTYGRNNPIMYIDPTGHWFGLDDLFASAFGAVTSVVSQYIGDVINNIESGRTGFDIFAPTSSWETYAGAFAGGAAAGETFLYTANPVLAGMAYGGTSTLVGQGLEALTGTNQRSFGEIAANTIGSTVGGGVGGATFMFTGSATLSGASGGGIGTATSQLLQNAFGVTDRSFTEIANNTIHNTVMGGINGFVSAGVINKSVEAIDKIRSNKSYSSTPEDAVKKQNGGNNRKIPSTLTPEEIFAADTVDLRAQMGTNTNKTLALPEGQKILALPEGKRIARITPGSLSAEEGASLQNTLNYIDAGMKPSGALGKKWGATFGNYEGNLPTEKYGTYNEYRVAPPAGTSGAGLLRVVVNTFTSDIYYTWTHYDQSGDPAFVQIR